VNRDDEISADSDEDLIYIEESQRLALDSMTSRENEPADYGTIEIVKLENFMVCVSESLAHINES
jgi:hypothetical protein